MTERESLDSPLDASADRSDDGYLDLVPYYLSARIEEGTISMHAGVGDFDATTTHGHLYVQGGLDEISEQPLVSLFGNVPKADDTPQISAHFVFRLEDIDALCKRLQAAKIHAEDAALKHEHNSELSLDDVRTLTLFR